MTCLFISSNLPDQIKIKVLKDTHREKALSNKTPALKKVWIWTFGSLVHQIKSLEKVLKLKQNSQKNKLVTGKTLFFVIGAFCSHYSICLNIGFWYNSFV